MSHMCTRCRNVFDEGTDILKGCPVCGWKKFMFVKARRDQDASASQKDAALETESKSQEIAATEEKPESKVESIRITEPGTYELNLPTLFERDELIMAVKEGTYLIDLSSAFRKPKKDKVQNQNQ
ncbi:MAG TPA: Zn-ribbon domain-containing protein [Methanotrichaceae archaeon]|nr:Zn-ribbon domain-containing protein [Methanotrichaceae archaeon]